jgi:hypothetical protein
VRKTIILLAALASFNAGATVVYRDQLTCPYDGTQFTETWATVMPYDVFLHGDPVPGLFWRTASCPTDGFPFFKENFSDEELTRLKPLVLSDEFQAMRKTDAYSYRVLWLVERLGPVERAARIGYLFHAIWEARRSHPKFSAYATQLLPLLQQERAERLAAGKPEIEREDLYYGDLLRQLGRFEEARSHFSSLNPLASQRWRELYLEEFLDAEFKLIQAGDTGAHLESEVLPSRKRPK